MSRKLFKNASLALALAIGATGVPAARAQITSPAAAKAKAKIQAKKDATKAAPIDLNTATAEEMADTLPGVGEVTAKKIIAGRPYTTVDGLSKAGVSAKEIEVLRPLVTVSAPAPAPAAAKAKAAAASRPAMTKPATTAATKPATTLTPGKLVNLNTATKEELDALPGIGPVRAQGIIEARPFKTKEDVMKVKGIKEVEFGKIKDLISVK